MPIDYNVNDAIPEAPGSVRLPGQVQQPEEHHPWLASQRASVLVVAMTVKVQQIQQICVKTETHVVINRTCVKTETNVVSYV